MTRVTASMTNVTTLQSVSHAAVSCGFLGYNRLMERLLDKAIVIACCLATVLAAPFSTGIVVGMLIALTVSGLFELSSIPRFFRWAALVLYCASALFVHQFVLFVPLIAYDCLRTEPAALKGCWIVPLLVAFAFLPMQSFFFVLVLTIAACGLSFRTSQEKDERERFTALRDELREASLSLEQKNRDLQDKQDYEVTLATLNERGRIAREIHDNVGHLLTRSVLQVEALQVTHAGDPSLTDELAQVGATLHEALDTVRVSVHDLHDDSFDLRTQLTSIARDARFPAVDIDYDADFVPAPIGYCFIAIVREALSNAAKHSDADRVRVSVAEYPAFYRLIVHDNGSKPPTDVLVDDLSRIDEGRRGSGIGLRTMGDRTCSLGGVFRAEYQNGFRLFASIPKGES